MSLCEYVALCVCVCCIEKPAKRKDLKMWVLWGSRRGTEKGGKKCSRRKGGLIEKGGQRRAHLAFTAQSVKAIRRKVCFQQRERQRGTTSLPVQIPLSIPLLELCNQEIHSCHIASLQWLSALLILTLLFAFKTAA